VSGAVRLARHLGPKHFIVTVLADCGMRYSNKLYNPNFLKEKGLPYPDWISTTEELDTNLKQAVDTSWALSDEVNAAVAAHPKSGDPNSKV